MFGKPSATTRRIWTVVATLAVCFALLPMAPALAATAYTLTINDVTVTEGAAATFTVTLTPAAGANAVSVNYATASGTALAGSDFGSAASSLTFATGQSTKTITVNTINDIAQEPTETYTVGLSGASVGGGDTVTVGDATGMGSILDDGDAQPNVTVLGPTNTPEGSGSAIFTISLNVPSGYTVTAGWATLAGTATAGSDYTTSTGTLLFAPGETVKTVVVPILEDTLVENSETFGVWITFLSYAGGGGVFTTNIIDNDQATWSVDSPSFYEGAAPGNMVFNLKLNQMLPGGYTPLPTVNFVTSSVSALTGVDFLNPAAGPCTAGYVDIAPAGASALDFWGCQISVPILHDTLIESNETFLFTLYSPTNSTIATSPGIGTIVDDDSEPTITVNQPSTSEAAGPMHFVVSLSGAYTLPVTVEYQTAVGSLDATADASAGDFTQTPATGWTLLTFAPGETTKDVYVPLVNDTVDEPTEEFLLNLRNAVNAKPQGVGPFSFNGYILDDDAPVLNINSPTPGTSEDAAFPPGLEFTVAMVGGPNQLATTVNWATASGTAIGGATCAAGIDFKTASGTLSWAALEGGNKPIRIELCPDAGYELTENFTVVLSGAVNATIGTGTGTGLILDADTKPDLTISTPAAVAENAAAGKIDFVVTLTGTWYVPVTVSYATANGTATAGLDYTTTSGTLTFAPGGPAAATQTISVPIINDTLFENANETFTVTLSAPVNATISTATGTGTINDDELIPEIDGANTSASEGAGNMVFTVSLNHASVQQVTVQYWAGNCGLPADQATYNVDYTSAGAWQTLVFNPGAALTQTVSFPIVDDSINEVNETFCLALQLPVNGTIEGGGFPALTNGTATIIDNDKPVLHIVTDTANAAVPNPCELWAFPTGATNSSQLEGGPMLFAAYLDRTPIADVTFNYATSNGTATVAGGDYPAQSGSFTILAGSTGANLCRWIPSGSGFTVTDDVLDEPNETLYMNLTLPVGETDAVIGTAQAEGIIEDGDLPALAINDISAVEGSGAACGTSPNNGTLFTFTLTATSPVAPGASVAFAYVDITAFGGTPNFNDYNSLGGPLALNPGATPAAGPWSLTVCVRDDTTDENTEAFQVNLTTPSGVQLAGDPRARATGYATIFDNDTSAASINDVSVIEGNGGTTLATFTVTLSGPSALGNTLVGLALADGTANISSDYQPLVPASLPWPWVTFPICTTWPCATGASSQTFSVVINGDLLDEIDETYFVNISAHPANPTLPIADAQGLGTIRNDDDVTAPVLTLPGNMTVEATGPTGRVVTFVATATDLPHPAPAVTCAPPSGTMFPLGTTTVTCSATDAATPPHTTTGTFTITVVDTTPPIITMIGSSPVIVPQYGTYADLGATAFDLVDGDVTAWIVTVNPVDTSIVGTYHVTYDVMDSHGNHAIQVHRVIEVVPSCNGLAATIIGTAGDDTLTGTPGDDVFAGLEGADTIYGLGGNDQICGGPGSDMLYGGEGDDMIIANAGADMLYGEAGHDALYGGVGNDRFFGGAGDDLMMGGTGFDVLDYSGAGAAMTVDLYAGTASGDGADSLLSIERLIGSAFDDTLIGGPADNTIWGGAGNDTIYGGGGNDLLYGQDGDDTLYGQGGDDALYGGPGDDILIGGQGDDLIDSIPEGFVFPL